MKESTTLLAHFLGVALVASASDFEPRCGDCWCISHPRDECPELTEGLTTGFSLNLATAFKSHQLLSSKPSDVPRLYATNDDNETTTSECFPFPQLDKLDRLPQASWKVCDVPTTSCSGDDKEEVCAFRYLSDGVQLEDGTCHGRKYDMITYASEECAKADGAVVTHYGKCGVCSSAQDLAVMGGTVDSSLRNSLVCSFVYFGHVLAQDFSTGADDLVKCYEKLGYTPDCAYLWAMASAVSALRCTDVCLEERQGNTNTEVAGPPPECKRSDCFQCAEDHTRQHVAQLGGRSYENSGIVSLLPEPCTSFDTVVHDSCAPTAPDSTGGGGGGEEGEIGSCQCSRSSIWTNSTRTSSLSTTSGSPSSRSRGSICLIVVTLTVILWTLLV